VSDEAQALRIARSLHHRSESLKPGDPLAPSITLTSTFHLPGDPTGLNQYGRWSNPTWQGLEDALAILEDAPVVVFPSGMAAIAAIFHTLLAAGDRVLLPSDAYYATRALAEKFLAPFGVRIEKCAAAALAQADFAGIKLAFIETPTNPGLDLTDIAEVCARAHAAGALVVVDNTTMTPLGQRPLELGADALVCSDTKAVNGHSDVLFGHVASRRTSLIERVRDWRTFSGAIPGSFEAWLVQRGRETLDVRFERMCTNAALLAERLEGHPKVVALRYPGLASHPAHAIAQRQMLRGGSMIALTLADKSAAERFIAGCRFMRAATSFGGVHTSAERRARWSDAVPEGFVRLSVGCEPLEALWSDMRASLDGL